MMNLFKHTSSSWVRYSQYEWKKDNSGNYFITPALDSVPQIYDPLKEYQQMVLDALNAGLLIRTSSKKEIREVIMDFVTKYGLLGLMTALPTTPSFIDYNAVYLPTNHFIRKDVMDTEEYLAHFFPFEKPDFHKKRKESAWFTGNDLSEGTRGTSHVFHAKLRRTLRLVDANVSGLVIHLSEQLPVL